MKRLRLSLDSKKKVFTKNSNMEGMSHHHSSQCTIHSELVHQAKLEQKKFQIK